MRRNNIHGKVNQYKCQDGTWAEQAFSFPGLSTDALTMPPANQTHQQSHATHSTQSIAAPSLATFTAHFGIAYPTPTFVNSSLGSTAVYTLPAVPSNPTTPARKVLIIHGINTPALGMLSLAQQLQHAQPTAHIVLYDLWGHGLSDSPQLPHAAELFEQQILLVLDYLGWKVKEVDVLAYSFGATVLVQSAVKHPETWSALRSVVLIAPSGLLPSAWFTQEVERVLALPDGSEQEPEVQGVILDWLEGGELVVPEDWRERCAKGEVVPEALKSWELREHQGYRRSVVSMIRHGGVRGQEEVFREFAGLYKGKVLGVLGELDDVCREEQLRDLGLENVMVVRNASHDLCRKRKEQVAEVAEAVLEFWKAR